MPSKFDNTGLMDCPFYYAESKAAIKCRDALTNSGLVGQSTVTCFATPQEKRAHRDDFCSGCYQGCEVYHAFEDKAEYEQ